METIPVRRSRPYWGREGKVWLGTALALLVIGLVKSINLLTLLACFMLVLPVRNLMLARRQLRGLIARRVLQEPIFAQTSFVAMVEIFQRGRKGGLGIRIVDEGREHRLSWFLPRLAGQETVHLERELLLPRRGRYQWAPLHVACGYPFGLLGWQFWADAGREGVILPRLGELHTGILRRYLTQASPTVGQERGYPRQHPTAQTEFHGLRLFRSGDSPRWIHWRTSARRGELMVREFEDMPSDHLFVIVELWQPAEEGEGREQTAALVETAISLAATLCWEWCRKKGDKFLLAVAGKEAQLCRGITGKELALELLECLAVQQGSPEPAATALMDLLANERLFAGPILLVSTRDSPLAERVGQFAHRSVACVNLAEDEYKTFFSLPGNSACRLALGSER